MLDFFKKLNLQLFGEGGDGGAAGEGAVGSEATGVEIPSAIPERARERYQKAVAKNAPTEPKTQTTTETTPSEGEKKSYADLIKSDEYKDEHNAYMKKTIEDRMKKYKGIEEQNSAMLGILETVASKYGVKGDSETFLADLAQKIEADDSYYEGYAMEHDISPEEARKMVTLERKVKEAEAREAEMRKQEAMRQQMQALQANAERTKQRFPSFDLNAEMQNEKFRRLCAVNNGDTTAAYMACHWEQLVPGMVQTASQQIAAQTAQAVAANKARPTENGVSGQAAAVQTQQDFRNMSLEQLRAYAAEQKRKKQGR